MVHPFQSFLFEHKNCSTESDRWSLNTNPLMAVGDAAQREHPNLVASTHTLPFYCTITPVVELEMSEGRTLPLPVTVYRSVFH